MKVEIPSLEDLYNKYTLPKVGDWIEVVEWYRKGKFWVSDCFRGGETGEVANIFYVFMYKINIIMFTGGKMKLKL